MAATAAVVAATAADGAVTVAEVAEAATVAEVAEAAEALVDSESPSPGRTRPQRPPRAVSSTVSHGSCM